MKKQFLLYTHSVINKNTNFVLSVILLIFIIFNCNTLHAKETVLWKQGADYVGLEQVGDESNDHPFEVDASSVYQVLNDVRIQKEDSSLFNLKIFDSKDDYSNEMFTRDELIKLSQNVSLALSKANSNQDVVFSITGRHEKTLGTANSTTTGRMFYSAGKLNLIIGEFRVDLAQKYRRQGRHSDVAETIDRDKLEGFQLRTGQRNKTLKPDFTFLENEHNIIHESANGKQRKDWLEIDFEKSIIVQTKLKESPANNNTHQSVNNSSKDYQALESKVDQLEQRLELKETQPTRFKSVNNPTASIEERLIELKSLLSKGLINEDNYNKKVQSILGEL